MASPPVANIPRTPRSRRAVTRAAALALAQARDQRPLPTTDRLQYDYNPQLNWAPHPSRLTPQWRILSASVMSCHSCPCAPDWVLAGQGMPWDIGWCVISSHGSSGRNKPPKESRRVDDAECRLKRGPCGMCFSCLPQRSDVVSLRYCTPHNSIQTVLRSIVLTI